MKLHLDNRADSLLIRACLRRKNQGKNRARHRIRIADSWYERSLIVTPRTVELWDAEEVSTLGLADFRRLADLGAEVVILGAGQHAVFPPIALTRPLIDKNIGLEVMDTAAACRTYNILAADGRPAVAALIA